MKNKRKKLLLLIIFFIWLCASIYLIQITYAKYLTTYNNTTDVGLSVWSIKVNGVDIAQNGTFTESVVPTFPGTEYIKSDSLVPGAVGYFDLEIDSSAISVPFTYSIEVLNDTILNEIDDIKLSGYSLDEGVNITPIAVDSSDPIVESVSADTDFTTVRIYITWYDGLDNTLTDIADTKISLDNGEFYLTASITFNQTVSQTINEPTNETV